ncbi:MAG: hypothetical protein ACYS6K_07290 [Planctomycetota bacterium]
MNKAPQADAHSPIRFASPIVIYDVLHQHNKGSKPTFMTAAEHQ